ncbi:CCD42 protein, partial [Smithornis capensis]|nr:CCD42 protein [Smithornis capensis]
DEESVSSFMCLLKKKKEFRCMENVLDENEGVFTERMEGLAERWRDLHARRAQLKAHVKTSGKTVQENEALQNQALKKAIKDKEQNIKRESELLTAQRELEVLRKQHQKLCKKLPKYSMFKKYLEDVVEISQFQDLEEIISFYKALVRSRKDLLQSQQWHKELTEQAKVLLEKYRAEKTADMLRCKNELAQLKQGLDKFRSDIPLWEGRWTDIQSTADKNTMMLKTIRGTIHNLFQ